MFPPGLEPGTLCVLGTRDNHYTTETYYIRNMQFSLTHLSPNIRTVKKRYIRLMMRVIMFSKQSEIPLNFHQNATVICVSFLIFLNDHLQRRALILLYESMLIAWSLLSSLQSQYMSQTCSEMYLYALIFLIPQRQRRGGRVVKAMDC